MHEPLRGLRVMTASGEEIGAVSGVGEDRFGVARTGLPDVWLTLDAVSEVRGDLLVLKPHSYELAQWQVGAE
ncbi:MAG: hypothetical protein AB7G21_08650 [Dehalococcoidia bacterium]